MKTGVVSILLLGAFAFVAPSKKESNSVKRIGLYEKADCTYFNPSNGTTSPGKKCISGNAGNCVSPAVCYPSKF